MSRPGTIMCAAIWLRCETMVREVMRRVVTRTNRAGRLVPAVPRQGNTSVQSLGELVKRRRLELRMTQTELGRRIKVRGGGPLSPVRVGDIENGRFAVRLPTLEQLPRALRIDPDVVYFWGGLVSPDIRVAGHSEATIKEAWGTLRAAVARGKGGGPQAAAGKKAGRVSGAPRDPAQSDVLRGWDGRDTLGGLITWRRRELGMTRIALSLRIKGSEGRALSKQRITDIEHDRFGVPRAPLLKQLARVLKLDIDVLYLWARRIPPDIRPAGLSRAAGQEAWRAFRAVIVRKKLPRRHISKP